MCSGLNWSLSMVLPSSGSLIPILKDKLLFLTVPLFVLALNSFTPFAAAHRPSFIPICLVFQGYYVKNNMLGPEGDFITSPEISQIFGEVRLKIPPFLRRAATVRHVVRGGYGGGGQQRPVPP